MLFTRGRDKSGELSTKWAESDKTLLTIIEHMCYYVAVWCKRLAMESELTGTSTWGPEFVEEPAEIEPDLPPEYCHYKDEGCELAAYCLNCPFPQCIYDEPRGRQRLLKSLRNREIARLFSDENKEVKELASMLRQMKTAECSVCNPSSNWQREKEFERLNVSSKSKE